ncbi:MAG: hypothetical protein B7Z78_03300 [Rhodospirillales bacterium 20-60-12]|nr:MAG: hypothetical protein B7Z78_03300 [Rhodospirillales bacterium 20-60-12]HQT68203.1 MFS transporter [Acetobacteraceae bacterium]
MDNAKPGAVAAEARPHVSNRRITWQILTTVMFNLVAYILIGFPLAVLPRIVHYDLGYSVVMAGLMISLQYVATLLTRSVVGRLSDSKGPKRSVLIGLTCASCSGLAMIAAGIASTPLVIMLWLALSRLLLGAAESGTGTGCIAWGIGRTGAAHTAEVISWNGVASYGGIALGAPAGVLLSRIDGLTALGIVTTGMALCAWALACLKPATPIVPGIRMKFASVLRQMLPYGTSLALGSVGFGTIVAFMALFYASRHWNNAAYALSAFGLAFVAVRIFFSRAIGRFGGYRTSIVSFVIESAGLLTLWLAPSPWVAVSGSVLTGFGLSLIFPAMAVEALKSVSVANRGAAIGLYTVFLDISLGATGPLAGLVIGRFSYAAVYLLAAMAAAGAGLLTLRLMMTSEPRF